MIISNCTPFHFGLNHTCGKIYNPPCELFNKSNVFYELICQFASTSNQTSNIIYYKLTLKTWQTSQDVKQNLNENTM